MKKYFICSLVFLSLITGCGKKNEEVKKNDNDIKDEVVENKENKKISIIDTESDSRPVAVMINNHPLAVPNHAGLQDAYITYEIVVEGGLTRLMAVFKDQNTARIGSVRSSRHYYLDYVLENDAIYTHFGYSDIAKNDISALGINNVNGLTDSGFFRDNSLNVPYEHTAFTSMENILNVAKNKGYRMTSSKKTLLNYSPTLINLEKENGSIKASNVSINYSYSQNTSYTYDEVNQNYKRFVNGNPHVDAITKNQYTYKNIIVLKVENYSLDGYLQNLNNIGTGDGYYITCGYAIPIKWNKKARDEQTIYTDLSGNEIKVNDGNTFIQIQPINETLTIN